MDRELEAKEGADPKQSFMIGKRNNTQKKTSRSWNSSPKNGHKSWNVLLQIPSGSTSQSEASEAFRASGAGCACRETCEKAKQKWFRNVFFSKKMTVRKFVLCIYLYIYIWIYIYIYIYIWYVLIYFTKKKGSKAVFLIDEFELLASLSTAGRKDAVCAARKTTIATLSMAPMAYGNGNSPHQGHQGWKTLMCNGRTQPWNGFADTVSVFPWPCWLQWWHWNVQTSSKPMNPSTWNSQLKWFTQGEEDKNRLRCQLPPRGFLLPPRNNWTEGIDWKWGTPNSNGSDWMCDHDSNDHSPNWQWIGSWWSWSWNIPIFPDQSRVLKKGLTNWRFYS